MIFSNCFRLICTLFPLIMTQPASIFSSASLRNFFSPIRKYFDASSIVSVYFSQIGTSVLFMLCTPFYCVFFFTSRQTALENLRWYLNQSHSYEQNHLWDVSLSCNTGHGGTTFPKVALGSLRGSLASYWKGHGVQFPWLAVLQTYLSALFTFQRTTGLSAYENLLKPADFHRVANMEIGTGKREWTNHVPTMYLFNL